MKLQRHQIKYLYNGTQWKRENVFYHIAAEIKILLEYSKRAVDTGNPHI